MKMSMSALKQSGIRMKDTFSKIPQDFSLVQSYEDEQEEEEMK